MGTKLEGRWVWYDLHTTDVEAAARFYGEVVGWKVALDEQYSHFSIEEEGVGGMAKLPPGVNAPPYWMGYIAVSDIDASVAKLKELGGEVMHGPFSIGETSRAAVVADPVGAAFALYEATGEADKDWEPRSPEKVGGVVWHELYSDDPDSSWDFMSTMFGWKKTTAMDMGEMGVYQLFGVQGSEWGAMMAKPEGTPVSAWNFYFTVDDVDAAAERVTGSGGTIIMAPHDVPGGRILVAVDPQGAVFALHHPRMEE